MWDLDAERRRRERILTKLMNTRANSLRCSRREEDIGSLEKEGTNRMLLKTHGFVLQSKISVTLRTTYLVSQSFHNVSCSGEF